MEKSSLRKQVLSRRATYSQASLKEMSSRVERSIITLPEFANSQILSSYVAMTGEVETRGIISAALREGKTVIVPKVFQNQQQIIFSRVLDMEKDLAPGSMGILEPRKECIRPVDLNRADVVLVPGVAWDTRGYRLGYGKGYYDKALAGLKGSVKLVGLGFEFQLVREIPREKHDIAVHMIITEERVIKCKCNA